MKLGIIGTGRIAQRFVSVALQTKGIEVVCVYNPNAESAERFAAAHEISCWTDSLEKVEQMVDSVYVASPHGTHYEYTKRMLQKGKNVLCEKPMALCQDEVKELFCLADENNCVLMEALKTAYCPGFRALVEIATSGKIGKIRDVEACFSRLTPADMREMTDEEYGGSVTEFGSYTLLPILRLLGTDYYKTHFFTIDAENGIDLYTKVVLEYESGMGLSKTGLGVKTEGQLIVAGTEGYIIVEAPWWLTRKIEVRYENPEQREVYEYPYEGSGLQYELTEFLNRVNGCETGNTEGLLQKESIAIAGVIEKLLQKRMSRKLCR